MARAPLPTDPLSVDGLEAIARRCRARVRRRAGLAAVGSAVPVPGLDLAIDAAVLISLLQDINADFGLTEAQVESLAPSRRRTVLNAIAAVGSSTVGRAITKALVAAVVKRVAAQLATKATVRYVPVVGQAIAGGLAYAAVVYVGQRHVDDCLAVHARLTGRQGADPERDRVTPGARE